jgi:DNA-binding transcriptional LysR family regulator
MADTQPDRADLELLVEIADTGSLVKAARALDVHHATAFRRLAELDRRAGTPMFNRRREGYVPTAAARGLIASARRLRSAFREFDAQLSETDRTMAEPLRVTTSDGLASGFFAPLLRAFGDAHPAIVVELIVENRVLSVPEHEVDVALRPAREVSGDMVCRRIATIGYSLYASREYVRRHGSLDASMLDFSAHAICAYSEDVSYFTTARWLQRHATRARVVSRCNSLTAMQSMARAGMCIAALPCVVGNGDADLIALLPPIHAMETSLWICTHRRLRKASRVRAFLDFFYDAIEKEKSRLAGRRRTS